MTRVRRNGGVMDNQWFAYLRSQEASSAVILGLVTGHCQRAIRILMKIAVHLFSNAVCSRITTQRSRQVPRSSGTETVSQYAVWAGSVRCPVLLTFVGLGCFAAQYQLLGPPTSTMEIHVNSFGDEFVMIKVT